MDDTQLLEKAREALGEKISWASRELLEKVLEDGFGGPEPVFACDYRDIQLWEHDAQKDREDLSRLLRNLGIW